MLTLTIYRTYSLTTRFAGTIDRLTLMYFMQETKGRSGQRQSLQSSAVQQHSVPHT